VSILSGIGFSQHVDPVIAAKQAADRARRQLAQERIDLAIVFNTIHYDPKVFLPVLHDALDQTRLIGSSTAGIMLSTSIETQGIAVLLLYSDSVRCECALEGHLNLQDYSSAGNNLAKICVANFGEQYRKLFLFFADGSLFNPSKIAQGIKQQIGDDVFIVGAGSSDNLRLHKTYQYHKNSFASKGVAGLLLGGKLNFGVACQHGWRPLGKPRLIDKTEGNTIHTIDGQRALHLYEEYFAQEAKTLKEHPLGQINIRYPLGARLGSSNEYLLRNIFTTLDDGSLICQDSLDPETEVHIMIMSPDSCVRAGQGAAQHLKEQMQTHPPSIVLAFESAVRAKLLGRNALKELRAINNVLGPIPFLGMHTYGEMFSCQSKDGIQTLMQNNSILLLGLS
jgi:hypothetical protein